MCRFKSVKVWSRAGLALLCSVGVAVSVTEASWPGLRGPSYDGSVRDAVLFDAEGGSLSIAWSRTLGSGYSVVAVDGERLVTSFQEGDSDFVGAFDPESGEELWRYRIGEAYPGHDGSHDGPISTPFLADGRVHGLGPRGDLFTLDAATGEALWTTKLVEELEAEAPFYGFTSSPLVAEGVLVVEIGAGEGRAVGGFDPDTGELLWTTGTDSIRYQSPVATEIGGRSMVLALGNQTIMGLEPTSGELLWSYEHGGDQRDMGGNTIVPVPAGDGRILLMNQHPKSVMLQVESTEDGWAVSELWSSGSIKSSYVQPVYHDGYIYGMNSKIFTCVDAATGETVWRSREPGDGFPTIVGDHLVIMEKPGTLRVARLSPEGYEEVASVELFREHSWSAPAYANGSLYLRSMGHLARIDPVPVGEEGVGGSTWIATTAFGRFLEELATATDKAERVDEYLARQRSIPIVEPSGAVHFVYRGEAQDVGIVGDMIGYRREDPMTRVEGTDLFYYSTLLEADAAVSYGFIVDFSEPIADPLNPHSASGLFGDVSFLAMPARQGSDFLGEADASRRGTLQDVEWVSQIKEGKTRKAQVYLPAGYDPAGDRRYPVAYVVEGDEALEDGGLQNALDNLIGEGVEPLIGVFIHADPENRGDLFPYAQFAEMIVTELVPVVDERFLTDSEPGSRAIVGSSDGGDVAFTAVFQNPETFHRLGALWPIVFDELPEVPAAAEHPFVIFQIWGTYHLRSPHEAWDQVEDNRSLWRALRAAGHKPSGGEVPEGFGWECWRDHLDEMFQVLFPSR